MDRDNSFEKRKEVGQVSIANNFERRRNTIMEGRQSYRPAPEMLADLDVNPFIKYQGKPAH